MGLCVVVVLGGAGEPGSEPEDEVDVAGCERARCRGRHRAGGGGGGGRASRCSEPASWRRPAGELQGLGGRVRGRGAAVDRILFLPQIYMVKP